MKNNLAKIIFISSLSLDVIGASFLANEKNKIKLANADDTSIEWGHYSKVEATYDNAGCKEFWISCDSHEVVFTKPTTGIIKERNNPSVEEIESWKDLDDGRYINKIDSLFFGVYPQSQVTDEIIIKQLNDISNGTSDLNPKKWSAFNYWYQSNSNQPSFGWYLDLDVNNDGEFDYRGVYFTSYRPHSNDFSGNTYVDQQTFQPDFGYYKNTIYWFKYEPLEWKILFASTDDLFLMSQKIIDNIQFSYYENNSDVCVKTDYQGNSQEAVPNNYKYSDLRLFLNTDMYNLAFNQDEKDSIKVTNVDNSPSSCEYLDTLYYCENTEDKLFALSYKEITNPIYGFESTNGHSETRVLGSTDYSKCVGGIIWWATRSPSDTRNYRIATTFGGISNGYENTNSLCGVVPAMHIARSK